MTDPAKTKLVIEILHLAYLVHVATDYCVFIDFSGHIDSLSISIRASVKNWRQEVLETEFSTAYREHREDNDPSLAYLRSKADVLREVLTTHEVPFDLDYKEIYTRQYTF